MEEDSIDFYFSAFQAGAITKLKSGAIGKLL